MKNFPIFILFISFYACNESKSHTANNIQPKEKIQSINDSLEKATKNNAELLNKIEVTDVNLISRGTGTRAASVYGSGVTMYFNIKNSSEVGIKKVFFNGKYKFEGRSYIHSEDINYEFRQGLEPGETQEIAMRPGTFSEWNEKIQPADKGEFELDLKAIEDYNGKQINKE